MNWLTTAKNTLLKLVTQAQPRAGYWLPVNTSGVAVSHEIALSYVTLWTCVLAISDPLSMLPFSVHSPIMAANPDSGFKPNRSHPVTRLMNRRPNPEMTPFTVRQTLISHALLRGNGYAEITRDAGGIPRELWPIPPNWCELLRVDGDLFLKVVPPGGNEPVYLPYSDVFHLKGMGYDGVTGYDVVTLQQQAIGSALAAERYSGSFFGNGAHISSVLMPKDDKRGLGDDAVQKIREGLEMGHRGSTKAFRTGIIPYGLELKQLSIPPEAAQLIETRKFDRNIMAAMLRVPPHIAGDYEQAHFNNVEQSNIVYVQGALMPWATRLEQEADLKLLGRDAQRNSFCNLDLSYMLRGDVKTRWETYRLAREWGLMSANEIRGFEDLPPLPSDIGDRLILPKNYVLADRMDELMDKETEPRAPAAPGSDPDDDDDPSGRVEETMRGVLAANVRRVLSREHHRMAEKFPSMEWTDAIAVLDGQQDYAEDVFAETLIALAPLLGVDKDGAARAGRTAAANYRQRHETLWSTVAGDPPDVREDGYREPIVTDLVQLLMMEATTHAQGNA